MKDYERLTNAKSWEEIDLKEEYGYKYIWERLKSVEDKIERGEIDYVADKDKEIARLTSKLAELRERLEKAVILPILQVVKGNRRPYELVYKDQNGRVIITKYRPYDKYEAEARLADLKGDRE